MKKLLIFFLLLTIMLLPSTMVYATEMEDEVEEPQTRSEWSGLFNETVDEFNGAFDTTSPWLKDADMSIYDEAIDAKDPELDIEPKNPGVVEKKVAELIRNLSSSLIEMLEKYMGASLDKIVYGRVGSGNQNGVNIFSFELRKGNPYGVTAAIIYTILRSIVVLFVAVSYTFTLAKATWSGQTGRSREEIKSNLYNTLYIFALLALVPFLIDLGLYIRDVILYGIKIVMGELVSNGAVFSLTTSFLTQAETSKRLLDALMYLGTVLLTMMFIFLYCGLALDMLVGFMIFPGVAVRHNKNNNLIGNWVNIMVSHSITPIIDAVLLLVPLLTSIMLADTVKGLWFVQLIMCMLIVPARDKAKRFMGLQASDKNGLLGAFAMLALGKQIFGMGKKGAGRLSEIHSDREKAKTHDELANVDKEAEESMMSSPIDTNNGGDHHDSDVHDDDQFNAGGGEDGPISDSSNEEFDSDSMGDDYDEQDDGMDGTYGDESDNGTSIEDDSGDSKNGEIPDVAGELTDEEEHLDESGTDVDDADVLEPDQEHAKGEEDQNNQDTSTPDENTEDGSRVDIDATDHRQDEESSETDIEIDDSEEANKSEEDNTSEETEDIEQADHKSDETRPDGENKDSSSEGKSVGTVNAANVNEARRAIQDGLKKRQSKIDQLRGQKAAQVARQRKYEREMLNYEKDSDEYNDAAKKRADAAISAANIDRQIAGETRKMNDLRNQAEALKSYSNGGARSSGAVPTSFDERKASILAKRANIDNFEQPDYFNSLSNAQKAELYRKRAKSTGIKMAAEVGGGLLGGTMAAGLFSFTSPQTAAAGIGGGIAAGSAVGGAATTAGRVIHRSTEQQVSDILVNGSQTGGDTGAYTYTSNGYSSGRKHMDTDIPNMTPTGQKVTHEDQPSNPGDKDPVIDKATIEKQVLKDVETAIGNSISSDHRFMDSECLNAMRRAADEADAYALRRNEAAEGISEEDINLKRVDLQTDALTEVIVSRLTGIDRNVSEEYKMAKQMVEESVRKILEDINQSLF